MVRVTSEIGRLRRVLVHEPGPEVDCMVPSMMQELLFDDILFGDRAREEHALFRRTLQILGVEVVESATLLEETLGLEEARSWLLDVLPWEVPREIRARLAQATPQELAARLVEGWQDGGGGHGPAPEQIFGVLPLPNWCFQRDPQIVLGDGVIFSAMAASARHFEAMLSRAIFRFHPDFAQVPVLHDPLETGERHHLFIEQHRPRLEGGDLLVLSPEAVVVGLSERTNRTAVLQLVAVLAGRETGLRWLFTAEVPPRRAFMHLDTLITPVDRDACLLYPPVLGADAAEPAAVHEFDLHAAAPRPVAREGLLPALARRGISLEPIPCGGPDPIAQQREQWTDGANALAVAPGVILLYDRNLRTADELARRGFRVVVAKDLVLGREEVDLESDGRVCVLVPSHEMSRARGGPHCLSHPLVREAI